MSNIIRRPDDQQLSSTRNPFRWMQDLLRWDPAQEMAPTWTGPGYELTFNPAFEVKETKEGFVFKADLPGIKESDVEVKLTGNRLAISGKREVEHKEKTDTYYTFERSYGSFQRMFTLPEGFDTDHVVAQLKDGVLSVTVPKLSAAQTKTVTVKTGSEPKS
ncbi:MAG: heat-shock protein Hsp20 [Deltaproteobacteria bacterium]|nr:heat-shock protein Hsp20 [Deltaproteobacteria bacterium]